MGGHLLSLYTSSQASRRITLLTAHLPISIRRTCSNQGKKENNLGHAPSTAEEFERVAEEKSRQGLASQTVEKAQDAAREAAAADDSTLETVKEAYKEPPGKGNFKKTGDE